MILTSLFRKPLKPIKRNFSPAYFLDQHIQDTYVQQGYVVIRNVVPDQLIEEALLQFDLLQKKDGYRVDRKFESSGNFPSVSLQQFVFEQVARLMQELAPRFANLNHCQVGTGGAYFIKPPTKESELLPHQDNPVVDERKSYAVFTWIPLHDVEVNNGTLWVLPGSHLWGNVERSQHIPWAFRNLCQSLKKYMVPLELKRGDMICFDPSIIHGSGVNKGERTRLVLSGALLPKQLVQVDYMVRNGMVEQREVKNDYWMDGGHLEGFEDCPLLERQPYAYPNPMSRRDVSFLLRAEQNSGSK